MSTSLSATRAKTRVFAALCAALILVAGFALDTRRAEATSHSVDVLCHSARASFCSTIIANSNATTSESWTDAQFQSATVADFQRFRVIYLQDSFSFYGATAARDVYGAAVDGRAVLSGIHFEHAPGHPGARAAIRDSINWVLDGTGTGIVVSTQYATNGSDWIPSIAPFNGVSYRVNGGGYEIVRVDDPGHATMQGSTNSSLSNFGQSAHSIFDQIGSFTSVASICDVSYTRYNDQGDPAGQCSSVGGTMYPHHLVTSVGVADQDGDGVPNNTDNCQTVTNPGQEDQNNNGVGDACESAPTVDIDPDAITVAPGGSVTFTTTAADSDDPVSSLTYEWRVNGIVQPGETSDTFTTTFTADSTVRVTVRDPGLLSGFDEAEVTVGASNSAPTVSATADSILEDGTASIDVTVSDDDGDPIDVTINWADGSAATTATVTSGTHTFTHQYLDDDPTNTPADTYTVSIDASDAEETASTTTTVDVANVAPVAADPGTVNGTEGSSTTVSADFSDVGSLDTHTGSIAWGDATADGGSVSGTTVSGSHVYDDSGSYTATATVTDDDTGTDDQTISVEIANVAPTATFGNNGPVDEGQSFELSLTDPSDPSTADTNAGFEYRFDCGDGTGFGAWSTANTANCATDDNATRNVVGQLRDKDEDATSYAGTVTVHNVAPTVEAGPDQSITFGDTVTLDAWFDDPGADAPWTVTIDWGDGTPPPAPSPATEPGEISGEHQYLTLGDHTVVICATDKDLAEGCDTMTVFMPELRARKQDVRDRLADMLPTGDDKDDYRIEKALKDLDKSLDPELWADDGSHLDPKHGDKVLKEERDAVKDLEKVEFADVTWAIDELVEIDRTLASIEITEARAQIEASSGDPKYLEKAADYLADAEEYFAEGDAERDDGDPEKAIYKFRKAWDKAIKAKEKEAKAVEKAAKD